MNNNKVVINNVSYLDNFGNCLTSIFVKNYIFENCELIEQLEYVNIYKKEDEIYIIIFNKQYKNFFKSNFTYNEINTYENVFSDLKNTHTYLKNLKNKKITVTNFKLRQDIGIMSIKTNLPLLHEYNYKNIESLKENITNFINEHNFFIKTPKTLFCDKGKIIPYFLTTCNDVCNIPFFGASIFKAIFPSSFYLYILQSKMNNNFEYRQFFDKNIKKDDAIKSMTIFFNWYMDFFGNLVYSEILDPLLIGTETDNIPTKYISLFFSRGISKNSEVFFNFPQKENYTQLILFFLPNNKIINI